MSDTAEGMGLFSGPQCKQTNMLCILTHSHLLYTPVTTLYREKLVSRKVCQKTAHPDQSAFTISARHLEFVALSSRPVSLSLCVNLSHPPCVASCLGFPFSLKEMGFSWLHTAAVLTAWRVRHHVEASNGFTCF